VSKDKIDEALDLGPGEAFPQVQLLTQQDRQDMTTVDSEDDFEFARRNIRELINSGKESLELVQEVAASSEAPRAFEVVATLIDKLVVANERLVVIGDKKRESLAKAPGTDKVVNNTQNIMMVGSTDDMFRVIKKNRGESDGEDELER